MCGDACFALLTGGLLRSDRGGKKGKKRRRDVEYEELKERARRLEMEKLKLLQVRGTHWTPSSGKVRRQGLMWARVLCSNLQTVVGGRRRWKEHHGEH